MATSIRQNPYQNPAPSGGAIKTLAVRTTALPRRLHPAGPAAIRTSPAYAMLSPRLLADLRRQSGAN
ncbi:MAG: hypothetical protein Tsb0032_17830 [Kiloniellaceae bacterium]